MSGVDWKALRARLASLAAGRESGPSRTAVEELLARRARSLLASGTQPPEGKKRTVVVFRAAGTRWAVSLDQVRQVRPCGSLGHLPGAPEPIIGLAALRGRFLPVVDLGVLYGGGRVEEPRFAVELAAAERGPLGLAAESVEGIEAIDASAAAVRTEGGAAATAEGVVLVDAVAVSVEPRLQGANSRLGRQE